VLGTDHLAHEGVLWGGTSRRFGDVADGLSNTLMLGERPPAGDFWYGWWYAGFGMGGTGALDAMLGVREVKARAPYTGNCERGPYHFRATEPADKCAVFHFWSFHPGGAHFAMCDGSVHFLAYSADAILPALATRAGNEAVELP
jgi:prepilin-type processing-associated H-X9-DG protein